MAFSRRPRRRAVTAEPSRSAGRAFLPHPAAIVSGYPALVLTAALRGLAREGFFDRLAPGDRADVLEVIAAIEAAGRAWRGEPGGVSGRQERPGPALPGVELQSEGVALMTLDQAAASLAVSERTVRRLVAGGDLPSVRLGRARRIHVEDLATYAAELRKVG